MQRDRRFRAVFPKGHVVLPVVHVSSRDQAHRNTETAYRAGADGVFLINHCMAAGELFDINEAISEAFPDWWIGVNCLDLAPVEVVRRASKRTAGIWVDNAMIAEDRTEQPAATQVMEAIRRTGWPGLYFGGVAFKYQRHVDDLQAAARLAQQYMDVVTTSGPGTGQAAYVEKIRVMKSALGSFPLAIASGITPMNVKEYLPWSDCYLVATGISDSFDELNPVKVEVLVNTVRRWDGERGQE